MAKLFGISGNSNRDGTKRSHWGKNEFNSSFPTALLCYMHHLGIDPVYLTLSNDLDINHSKISVEKLFLMNPEDANIHFAFEESFQPYQSYIQGSLQRSDIVIMDTSKAANPCCRGFEIKLTALPDNSTHKLDEEQYSCELVFRPPAIEQLALSIAHMYRDHRKDLLHIMSPICSEVYNWRKREDVIGFLPDFLDCLNAVFKRNLALQQPFAIQTVWKTKGKSTMLASHCLDVFVWSDLAFTRLFMDRAREATRAKKIDRNIRSVIWVTRMLHDFAQSGRVKPSLTTSEMAYELQTDKAFAVSGRKSWQYLKSCELTSPRISMDQIKEIILDGGQNLLSPERRFDAIIVNTPGLFQ